MERFFKLKPRKRSPSAGAPRHRKLKENFTKPKSDVEAIFSYQPVPSSNAQTPSAPIEKVRNCKAEFEAQQICKAYFAMTSLRVDSDLESKTIAYDGLLVFVAFSPKDDNLPKLLNGKISLEQLRQIYTGKITNWRELGGPNLQIKPYIPTKISTTSAERRSAADCLVSRECHT